MYTIYHIHTYIYIYISPWLEIRSTTRGNPSPADGSAQDIPAISAFALVSPAALGGSATRVMAMDHLLEPQREKCWWKKQLYIYHISYI